MSDISKSLLSAQFLNLQKTQPTSAMNGITEVKMLLVTDCYFGNTIRS